MTFCTQKSWALASLSVVCLCRVLTCAFPSFPSSILDRILLWHCCCILSKFISLSFSLFGFHVILFHSFVCSQKLLFSSFTNELVFRYFFLFLFLINIVHSRVHWRVQLSVNIHLCWLHSMSNVCLWMNHNRKGNKYSSTCCK